MIANFPMTIRNRLNYKSVFYLFTQIGNKTVCVPVNASVRDEMSFTINALKERLAPGPHTARVRAVSLFGKR